VEAYTIPLSTSALASLLHGWMWHLTHLHRPSFRTLCLLTVVFAAYNSLN
jgi:hypothetical protein